MKFGVIRSLAVAVAIALAMVLLAACEEEEEEGAPATPETPAAETPVGETPGLTPGAETPAEETPAAGASELRELAQATEAITAKVTYNWRSTFDGQTMEGTWTLVQRPPDSRIDFSGTQDGQAFSSVVINAGGKSYWCAEVEGEGQCLAVATTTAEEQAAIFDPFFETTGALAEDGEGFDLLETSERTVAGVDATCWRVQGTALLGFQEAEMCFSQEGILLLSRTTSAEGEFSVEATEATTDVSDADFEPPYEVTELPGDFELPTPP